LGPPRGRGRRRGGIARKVRQSFRQKSYPIRGRCTDKRGCEKFTEEHYQERTKKKERPAYYCRGKRKDCSHLPEFFEVTKQKKEKKRRPYHNLYEKKGEGGLFRRGREKKENSDPRSKKKGKGRGERCERLSTNTGSSPTGEELSAATEKKGGRSTTMRRSLLAARERRPRGKRGLPAVAK